MAKVLKEMPRKAGGSGRRAMYPYDLWLDGQIWQLDNDEDYKAKPQSVVASIRGAAEARGLKLRSRFIMDDHKNVTGIAVQAFEPGEDEEEIPATSNGHKEVAETLPKSTRRPRKATTV